MLTQSLPVVPPAPKVHVKDLPTWRHLLTAQRNSIGIIPDYAFAVPFARRTLLGVDAVLINNPEGIRHVMATNATNYVRPKMMPRALRPLLGQGIFLAEGTEWRRQRRMLSPAFTPHNVGLLLPHFTAAANDLLRRLEASSIADLSEAFQMATLEAGLRAMFSMPDSVQRARLGAMVRGYVEGPGHPNILDMLARDESAFAFATRSVARFRSRGSLPSTRSSPSGASRATMASTGTCSIFCSPRAMSRRARRSPPPKYATSARLLSLAASRPRRACCSGHPIC
jgi:cytochrome P450